MIDFTLLTQGRTTEDSFTEQLAPITFTPQTTTTATPVSFDPIPQAHAGHDHSHDHAHIDHHDPVTHPLLANSWSTWMPEQIDDGSIDIVIDKTMEKKARRYVKSVLREVDSIIDTPITWKQRKPGKRHLDKNKGRTDIFLTDKEPYEDWDRYGSDPLTEWEHAGGLAFVSEEMAVGSWRTDYYKVKHVWKKGGMKRKVGITSYGKQVITHEILHTLGLSHPEDDGLAAGYDYSSTVMSYNPAPLGSGSRIRDLDIDALQTLWGGSLSNHSANPVDDTPTLA